MTDARGATLERIRGALGDASQSEPDAEYAAIPRAYIRAGRLDADARLHEFKERLRDYDSNVVESSTASLSAAIAEILKGHRQKKVVVAHGFAQEILPGGFAFIPEREASLDDLNTCDGIITVCTVAIAFTGTIVLTHGPGEGARRLTLLPDRHLCVVRAEQIVETVPEAMDRLAPFATRPLTFVSGPSATADIEMTRIRGVHGPRFLDVVLVL